MVVRLYSIFVMLLLIFTSCKIKNLYKKDIRMEKNSIENLNKIRFDGYYYNHFYNIYKKKLISSMFFLNNNTIIHAGGFEFISFDSHNKFLLSEEFIKRLKTSKVGSLKKYIIKGDTIITQFVHGGGTYEKHISTGIYIIYNKVKIKNIKSYGLDVYNRDTDYIFKEFKDIHKVTEKITSLKKQDNL